jgi:hypothetical protein
MVLAEAIWGTGQAAVPSESYLHYPRPLAICHSVVNTIPLLKEISSFAYDNISSIIVTAVQTILPSQWTVQSNLPRTLF